MTSVPVRVAPAAVRLIAAVLVVVTAMTSLLSAFGSGIETLHVHFIRIVVICILAYFILQGANWSRWVMVALATLGTGFALSKGYRSTGDSLDLAIHFASAAYSAFIALSLVARRDVSDFFASASPAIRSRVEDESE